MIDKQLELPKVIS